LGDAPGGAVDKLLQQVRALKAAGEASGNLPDGGVAAFADDICALLSSKDQEQLLQELGKRVPGAKAEEKTAAAAAAVGTAAAAGAAVAAVEASTRGGGGGVVGDSVGNACAPGASVSPGSPSSPVGGVASVGVAAAAAGGAN